MFKSSPNIHPTDHTSIEGVYFCRRINSGARYHLVATCCVICLRSLGVGDLLDDKEADGDEEEEDDADEEDEEDDDEEDEDDADASRGVLTALGTSISLNPLANPKSQTRSLQSSVNNTLPGLMSR